MLHKYNMPGLLSTENITVLHHIGAYIFIPYRRLLVGNTGAVKDKLAAREDEDVKAAEEEVAKELGDEGRLLLRESGTEPLIRVMVEAATDEICRENVDKIIQVLRAKGHEDKN